MTVIKGQKLTDGLYSTKRLNKQLRETGFFSGKSFTISAGLSLLKKISLIYLLWAFTKLKNITEEFMFCIFEKNFVISYQVDFYKLKKTALDLYLSCGSSFLVSNFGCRVYKDVTVKKWNKLVTKKRMLCNKVSSNLKLGFK